MNSARASVALAALLFGCGSSGSGATQLDASAPSDAGGGSSDADSLGDVTFRCAPADVSQFTPPAYKPAAAHPGACTQTQVDNFFAGCLAPNATSDACSAFTSANATCFACLLTSASDAKWGPLVDNGRFLSVNGDGCMELTGGTAGRACAEADQAASACEDQACAANCPINRDDSPARRQAELAAYDECTTTADHDGCAPLASKAADCIAAERDAGAAATACFGGKTFQDLYAAIAPVFCVGVAGRDGG